MKDNPSYDPRQAQGWESKDPVCSPSEQADVLRAIECAKRQVRKE